MTDISYRGSVNEQDHLLQDCFFRVGAEHGFHDVQTSWEKFKEFKATWKRCSNTAELHITDYMKGSDPELITDLARGIFGRMGRGGVRDIYSEKLRQHFVSHEFIQRNQPLYLKRSRNLAYRQKGQVHDLEALYDDLLDTGLVTKVPNSYLTWTKSGNRQRIGYCSVIMRVVAISSALDRKEVPSFVPGYVLYHELLHLENGLRFGSYHDREFRAKEAMHPYHNEAERWLRKIAVDPQFR
ncbi:MAG: hypothetical protein LUQ09_01355 [Methanomassiliicoccales archaeon]|nr:hypothetical protein [Methanomassiliicoccales archaeon]